MYKLYTRFLALLFIFCLSLNASTPGSFNIPQPGTNPISMHEAENFIGKDGVYFIDANPQSVYENAHIKGAIFIDFINAKDITASLPQDKNAKLIFYCANQYSQASSIAAKAALDKGYSDIYVMIDGIEGWILSGRSVEKSNKNVHSKKLTNKEVENYADVIHDEIHFGKTPTCRDCHQSKSIMFATRERKMELFADKDFVNDNCMKCHEKAKKSLENSIHGHAKLRDAKFNKDLPSCSDCHAVHTTSKFGDTMTFKQVSDFKCGLCHEKEQLHYHATFHGKAMLLNTPRKAPTVAACFDCHGTHDIHKVDDPKSSLYLGENRVKTCEKCHEGSHIEFAKFMAHADHTDGKRYPILHGAYIFMTGLVISVFVFFGIHTLLWTIRLLKLRFTYPKEWKEAKEKAHSDDIKINRFSLFHKIQHFFLAASFLGLGFSGLPQKFYEASWAQGMMDLMGGPIIATKIHHISAFIMIVVFLSHIVEICAVAWKNRAAVNDPISGKFSMKIFLKKLFGPDSLMPNLQDFRDIRENFLWFIGKRATMPQFDRWTYWEKFDYLAVFWGMFIIGLSGLVLWFPVAFTKIFPGQMLNLASLLHSDEALLALGFIFAVHFFHTHCRANKFPMDMVIFSGNLSQTEMLDERKSWYDRLKKDGSYEALKVKDNFAKYKKISYFIGYAMLITGFVFLAMMIYAYIEMIFA